MPRRDLSPPGDRADPPGWSTACLLAAKQQMRDCYARGERPSAAEYLERLPQLSRQPDRVVSLAYEEYCLREECGERPDPEEFCDRYAPWRDSLASQLRYHRLLSGVVAPSPPPPRYPEPDERIGGFHLRSVLGSGASGRVYLACDEELGGRTVALKLAPDRGREPWIMGRLDHPHIVPVLSVARDEATGLRALCMPYRPGLPLDEVVRHVAPAARRGRASSLWEALITGLRPASPSHAGAGWARFPADGTYAQAVAWVGAELAGALAHVHAAGVVHLDVKPSNVLLSLRDGPQLLDFDLAHAESSPETAEEARRGGTLPYMAPEQLRAFLDPTAWTQVGPASDIFALGLLMWELLTGCRPVHPGPGLPLARTIQELLDLRGDPDLLLDAPGVPVPSWLRRIVRVCLASCPRGRYPDASILGEELGHHCARRGRRDGGVQPGLGGRPSLRGGRGGLVHGPGPGSHRRPAPQRRCRGYPG